MFVGLSLDQAPPFQAPLKFFLVAPLFSLIAGLLLLNSDGVYLHSSYFIASLHLMTIGFIVMIVFGALLQMLPVVAGAVIKNSLLIANITFGLLIFGLISFVFGFMLEDIAYFLISAILLFGGLFLFSYIVVYKLFIVQKKSWIIIGMILSLICFTVAFIIGINLLLSYGTKNFSDLHTVFVYLHYNLIFFGFLFLLIASISFQVIPMFWVSEPYKEYEKKIILITTISLLFLYIVDIAFELQIYIIYKFLIGMISIYFATLTIKKLYIRKRKLKDISVYFYYSSMVFLILGIMFWFTLEFFKFDHILVGTFFGVGFVVTLMNGMLYKIVPFLTWFHLSSKGIFDIPTIRDMISVKKSELQYIIHIMSIILFSSGVLFNNQYLITYGVTLFIISNMLLFVYLLGCAKIYFNKKGKI